MAKISTIYENGAVQQHAANDEICDSSISFTSIGREHISLLKSFFDRYPQRSCDFTVGGALIWARMFDYQYAVIDDSLLIKGVMPDSGIHVFYAPCGEMDIKKFRKTINKYCLTNKLKGMIVLPEEELIGQEEPKEALFGEYMPEYKEYLYQIDKFNGFPGKKMEKKRNHLHYFQKHYAPYSVEEIAIEDIDELIDFTLKFESEHQDSEIADYECQELIEALHHYSNFPFDGIVVRKDGNVIGYSFGEKSGDTFVIHAEKANIEYRGAYQAVASSLAELIKTRYADIKYLNREDDMGDESLRQSKESYHPCLYIHKRRYFVR